LSFLERFFAQNINCERSVIKITKISRITARLTVAFAVLLFAAFIMPEALEAFATEISYLIPGGRTTGIVLHSEGAVITGFSSETSPAKKDGLKVGDLIVEIDGQEVSGKRSLTNALSNGDDEDFEIKVIRDGRECEIEVEADYNPQLDQYSIGATVKDTLAGIGTLTFIDPETGRYGALGHGICDPDTMSTELFNKGFLIPSTVTSVKKGQSGEPGELVGSYDMSTVQGSIENNTQSGIFGTVKSPEDICDSEKLKVAQPSEVKEGKAYILSNVESDNVKKYEIKIVDVNHKKADNRQMLIEVTDKELLSKTGGIVQGMSGSPIIQNGKLVGAVTHVLVNDPTRGYGIFVKTMLDTAA